MSFVGLVTRKEKDTGVSLMAKVVTESKNRFARQTFKVKVKANVLDDFTCCVIDHETLVDTINNAQDMSAIISDVTLSYNGINGTSISYKIIDIDSPLLSTYMTVDGKVSSRPKFGEGDAVGYLEVTVAKGESSVVSRILTSVSSISAIEVLNSAVFTQSSLWSIIKGSNGSYQQGSEWSGHNNIMYDLSLLTSVNVTSMSITPVTLSWSVVDNTLSYASAMNIYDTNRVNSSTGVVTRPNYKDSCVLIDAVSGVTIKLITADNTLTNRVRIGGLTLTASLSLGEATKDVVFNCATVSKYLTNAEVLDVVLGNIHLLDPSLAVKFDYMETADGSYNTLVSPAEGGTYVLRAYGNLGSLLFEAPELKLSAGQIIGVSITNSVYEYDFSIAYTNALLKATAFDGGFQNDDGETYSKLTIDYDVLAAQASDNDRKFSCCATISVSGYSSTGLTAGGGSQTTKRFAPIVVDTSSIV